MPTQDRASTKARNRRMAAVFAMFAVAGCGGDAMTPSRVQADVLYWDLALHHQAVTLSLSAPSDTLRLRATPRDQRGRELPTSSTATYVSRDLDRLSVTSDGVLRALGPTTQPVPVVATLTVGNMTHSDSVMVMILDEPQPPRVLASLSIHPIPPDSAKSPAAGISGSGHFADTLPIQVRDADGMLMQFVGSDGFSMTTLPVNFRSSDSALATVDPVTGVVQGLRAGAVTFYATTTVFGLTKADSLPYRIGWPLFARINVTKSIRGMPKNIFSETNVKVGVGALVQWDATGGAGADPSLETDVTFDDPAHVMPFNTAPLLPNFNAFLVGFYCRAYSCDEGGSFVLRPFYEAGESTVPNGLGVVMRTFPVAGIYSYRSTAGGTTGRIHVLAD